MDERSTSTRPSDGARRMLERALARECDIDPMILRVRWLRSHGASLQARCLEQELLPLF